MRLGVGPRNSSSASVFSPIGALARPLGWLAAIACGSGEGERPNNRFSSGRKSFRGISMEPGWKGANGLELARFRAELGCESGTISRIVGGEYSMFGVQPADRMEKRQVTANKAEAALAESTRKRRKTRERDPDGRQKDGKKKSATKGNGRQNMGAQDEKARDYVFVQKNARGRLHGAEVRVFARALSGA